MVRIGIVSERTRKKERFLFEGYHRNVIINEKNPFELTVVHIPYSCEQLEGAKKQRVLKAVLKARKILKDFGTEKILVSDNLKMFLDKNEALEYRNSKNEVFLLVAPQCIRKMSPRCGFMLPVQKVCIRANKMDRITEYLMGELSFDTRAMVIVTDEVSSAKNACERLFDETGLMAEISKPGFKANADVIIDTEVPLVRIGRDVAIEGAEFDFEMGGVCISSLEIAACIKNLDLSEKNVSYVLSKKKLTL